MAFFNTVTTDEQQSAGETANDQGPSETPAPTEMKVFKKSNLPMTKIMSAVMRSAAAVQGQTQAKKVAAAQQASNAGMSVTIKPGDDGEPRVTVKDAPASLLNGTQAQDVHDAYTTPKAQVEKKLSAVGAGNQPAQPAPQQPAAPTSPPAADHPLEQAATAVDASLGYRIPRPWDTDIAEKLKSVEGLRSIAEEMGDKNPAETAKQAWKQIQSGKARPQAVMQRIANFRADRIEKESHDLQATIGPYEDSQYRKTLQKDREDDNARLARTQTDTERKEVLKHKQEIIDKTDFSLIDPADLRKTLDSANASGVPFSEFEYRRAEIKARQDVNKSFNDFISNAERFRLGDFPTWEQAKQAFGHALDEKQDKQGRAAWDAARRYTTRLSKDAESKSETESLRRQLLIKRLNEASGSKPETVTRGDLSLMDTSELISADPATIKNYDRALEQKEGMLRKTLADAEAVRSKAAAQAKAIEGKKIKQFGDEEQYAGYRADLQEANRKLDIAKRELDAIQGRRADRRSGAPNVPHQPVANAQYSPEAEAGISAYMKAAGVGRAKAIEALRAAGRVK